MSTYRKLPKNYSPGALKGFKEKPTVPVEIDWSNPLTEGLRFFQIYQGVQDNVDLVTGQYMDSVAIDYGRDLHSSFFQSPTQSGSHFMATPAFDTTDWSGVTCVCSFVNSQAFQGIMASVDSGGFSGNWLMSQNGSIIQWRAGSSVTLSVSSQVGGSNALIFAAGTWDKSTLSMYMSSNGGDLILNTTGSVTDDFVGVAAENFIGHYTRSGGRSHTEPIYYSIIFDKELTAVQIEDLRKNPYQLLKAKGSPGFFTPEAAVVIDVPTGAYTFTGLAPTISVPVEIDVPTGSYTYTGLAPLVNLTVTVPTGAYTYSGLAPQVNLSINVPSGAYTYSGLAPIVIEGGNVTVDVPVGAYTYSGLAPQVNLSVNIPSGAYTYSGLVPIVVIGGNVTVDVPVGSYTYAGLAPQVNLSVNIPTGSYTYSGLAPVVVIGGDVQVNVPVGAYTYTGLAPVIIANVTVAVPSGAYTFTGLVPIVSDGTGLTLEVPVGSYTYSGLAPTLNSSIAIPVGAYTFTGLVPSAAVGIFIAVPKGDYTYSGLSPTVVTTNDIAVEIPAGGYTFKGLPPTGVFSIDIDNISADRTIRILLELRQLIVNFKKEF